MEVGSSSQKLDMYILTPYVYLSNKAPSKAFEYTIEATIESK